jgi:hypothetical protein
VTTRRILAPHEIRFLTFRNRFRMILADAPMSLLWRTVPLYVTACVGTALVLAVSGRFRSTWAVLRALAWPVRNPRVVRMERRRSRSLQKRPDREVLRPDLTTRIFGREGWRLFRDHLDRWEGP